MSWLTETRGQRLARKTAEAAARENPTSTPAGSPSGLLGDNSFELPEEDRRVLSGAALKAMNAIAVIQEVYLLKIGGEDRIITRDEFSRLCREKGVTPAAKRSAIWWNVRDNAPLKGVDPLSEEGVQRFLAARDAAGEKSLCPETATAPATPAAPALPVAGGSQQASTEPIPGSSEPAPEAPNFMAEAMRLLGYAPGVALATLGPDQAAAAAAKAKALEKEHKQRMDSEKRTAERLAQLQPVCEQAASELDAKAWEKFLTVATLAAKPPESFAGLSAEIKGRLGLMAPDAQSAALAVLRNPALTQQVLSLVALQQRQGKQPAPAPSHNNGKPAGKSGKP